MGMNTHYSGHRKQVHLQQWGSASGHVAQSTSLTAMLGALVSELFQGKAEFLLPPKSLLISENIPSQIQVKLCVHKIFGFTESTFSNTV